MQRAGAPPWRGPCSFLKGQGVDAHERHLGDARDRLRLVWVRSAKFGPNGGVSVLPPAGGGNEARHLGDAHGEARRRGAAPPRRHTPCVPPFPEGKATLCNPIPGEKTRQSRYDPTSGVSKPFAPGCCSGESKLRDVRRDAVDESETSCLSMVQPILNRTG